MSIYDPPEGIKTTGCLPRDDRCGDSFDVFEDHITPISRDRWDQLIESQTHLGEMVSKIRDQNGIGSCATESASMCCEIARNMELGKELWLEPCSISIYQTTSGGRDRGSSIGENLRFIRDKGYLPADTDKNKALMKQLGLNPKHVMRNRVFPQRYPDGWEETAKEFRATEWYDIATIDGLVTALFSGFPVSYGRSGHSICALGLVKRGGRYQLAYLNSWGSWGTSDFGLPYGVGYDNLSTIEQALPSYGAYAIRQVALTDPFLQALKGD